MHSDVRTHTYSELGKTPVLFLAKLWFRILSDGQSRDSGHSLFRDHLCVQQHRDRGLGLFSGSLSLGVHQKETNKIVLNSWKGSVSTNPAVKERNRVRAHFNRAGKKCDVRRSHILLLTLKEIHLQLPTSHAPP